MAMTIFALKKKYHIKLLYRQVSSQTFNDVVTKKQLPILC
jgi:hypothetical protein